MRAASKNYTKRTFVLKADIKKYFEHVDHTILLHILQHTIKDTHVLWLIKRILYHYSTSGKGMPLGNLTSQFFANVYLNELDQFVKHKLKAKYYVRYVDDFAIINNSARILGDCMTKINEFLTKELCLTLHPQKSSIAPLKKSVQFLGMRIFPYYRLLKHKNLRKFKRKLESLYQEFESGQVEYDALYDFIEGWCAYAKNANTYKLRKTFLDDYEKRFTSSISTKEVNRMTRPMRKKDKK